MKAGHIQDAMRTPSALSPARFARPCQVDRMGLVLKIVLEKSTPPCILSKLELSFRGILMESRFS